MDPARVKRSIYVSTSSCLLTWIMLDVRVRSKDLHVPSVISVAKIRCLPYKTVMEGAFPQSNLMKSPQSPDLISPRDQISRR